ncbi:hypothetical protein [Isoptericola sp. AK164]|uniref:hypothetical protein n=1 Tax=Isoptericola sp. AK164 TaxID=3024246 RepID=UPI002418B343|nr:hypothetical protein [Isoptericola sp. AK164]
MTSTTDLVAWADETQSRRDRDPGVYILAAPIIQASRVEDAREAMQALQQPREKKIHWREDSDKRHDQVIDTIRSVDIVETVVVVMTGFTVDQRETRRRRKVLERFLYQIAQRGCSQLTFESRGSVEDARDFAVVDALRAGQVIPAQLRVDHVPGPADPALWIADAVCGAITEARCGRPRWLEQIQDVTTVETVTYMS